MLFKYGTRPDVLRWSHTIKITLQFCDAEPADCPLSLAHLEPCSSSEGPGTSPVGSQMESAAGLPWRSKLFSATSHFVIATFSKINFLKNLVLFLKSRKKWNVKQLLVNNGVDAVADSHRSSQMLWKDAICLFSFLNCGEHCLTFSYVGFDSV